MTRIWWLASAALCLGLLAIPVLRAHTETPAAAKHEHTADTGVKLSERQIAAGEFFIRETAGGVIRKRLFVPGSIVPAGDRIAKVSVRLLGTVAELHKQLGDTVEAGDVLAIIESREVADAKSEYLATRLTFDLQQTLFSRAKTLSDAKVSSENEFLRARTGFLDVQNKFEIARQKLFTLGLSEQQIAVLPDQPPATLRRQELRAPIAGRIAERRVDLGSLVGREGQESELFVIVDTGVVWADLAVPAADLSAISEDQPIAIMSGATNPLPARILFISPMLDKDTRSARVVARVDNASRTLRPGGFVTAEIAHQPVIVGVAVPKTALQTVKGETILFVRTAEGFEPRRVTLGHDDGRHVEITEGVSAGEKIATANTFVLKAELGKSDAGHAD